MKTTSWPEHYRSLCYLPPLLAAGGLAYFHNQAPYAVGLLALLLLTAITFLRVEVPILCALVWPFFQYLLTRDLKLLPEFFTLIDECCLLAILAFLVWNLWGGKLRLRFDRFDAALLCFLAVGLLSSLLNGNPVLNTLLGLRCYVQYVILYYAISRLEVGEAFCRLLVRVMLGLVLMQVPLAVVQYFTWSPSSEINDHADAAYGTLSFGAANILGMLMLVFIFYLVKNRGEASPLFTWSALLLCAFALIISHSKVSFLFLMLLLLYSALDQIRSRVSLRELLVAALGLAVVVKVALMVSSDISNLLSWESFAGLIANQIEDKEGGGRIMYLLLTFAILAQHAVSPLLGLGPGMYSSYAGIALKSRYLVEVLGIDLERRGTRLDPDVIGVVGEYGYLGFLCFSLMILFLLWRAGGRPLAARPGFWGGFARWFGLFSIVFYLGGFVNGIWQAQFFAVVFWVAAGIYSRKSREVAATP